MTQTLLIELQATHDYLRTIDRDLNAFPPDLADMDAIRKALAKRLTDATRARVEVEGIRVKLQKELELTQRLEDHARKALKGVTQKVQYAAAMREVDDRERAKNQVAKPLKEAEARISALDADITRTAADLETAKAKFEELHAVFLAEHETQVASRTQLTVKLTQLETQLPAPALAHFHKLLTNRAGKAVAAIENGTCSGCRTRLRGPYITQVREAKQPIPCENCQRWVYMPDVAVQVAAAK
ncbi:MAG: hypothetical protein IPL96_07170 [Holophagaceae bacterium]|nr:hypothetical protein [Holophagaceae bacterium]